MTAAIETRNLGKVYRLGEYAGIFRYGTLRDRLVTAVRPAGRRSHYHWAVRDLSFSINPGEVVGIVGRNGAGKSTLLRLLAGITYPTEGAGEIRGRVGSLLEVGTGFHPELTGRENVFLNGALLGLTSREIRARFDAIVDFAEIADFLDTPVKRYSSGMYMRLAFAVAAHADPDVLLVDEVLAVGDARFQEKCLGKMGEVSRRGRTVIFVSHNMAAIRNLCSRALFLRQGQLALDAGVDAVVQAYMDQAARNAAEFETGPLTRANATATGGLFTLTADYRFEKPVRLPALGFVVSDQAGAPVFGSNPMLCAVEVPPSLTTRGRVRVRVRSPLLRSGLYRVSLWLGDGHEDLVWHPDCIAVEVVGATSRGTQSSIVGSVEPECDWEFEG